MPFRNAVSSPLAMSMPKFLTLWVRCHETKCTNICDLGVQISSDFKLSLHLSQLRLSKGVLYYSMVFIHLNLKIFISYVRSLNVVNEFNGFSQSDFKRVKLPSYPDRLANLGLYSLEYSQVYYNLLMCLDCLCEPICISLL